MMKTFEIKSIQLEKKSRTSGACMTCSGMFGSGVQTGIVIILADLLQNRKARRLVLSAFLAAAVGTAVPPALAWRAATGATRTAGTTTWASGLSCPQVSEGDK